MIARVHNRDKDRKFCVLVGGRIRSERIKDGISQQRLADMLQIDANVLRRIERGYVATHITTLKQIADSLGRDVKDFL